MPRSKNTAASVAKQTETAQVSTSKRAYHRKVVSIVIQYAGSSWQTEDLEEQAIATWASECGQKKAMAKDIKIYVKPEENMVYYVINDISGSFPLQ